VGVGVDKSRRDNEAGCINHPLRIPRRNDLAAGDADVCPPRRRAGAVNQGRVCDYDVTGHHEIII
jgi:hypothetical protein